MARAAALTILMALLPARLASQNGSKSLEVNCAKNSSPDPQTVTAANTVLTVLCPESWKIEPRAEEIKVCEIPGCKDKVPLIDHFATAENVEPSPNPGVKITFKKLPESKETFTLSCKSGSARSLSETCDVEVILNKPPATPPGGPSQPPPPDSGTPSVQTCKPNESITLKMPEKGSTAQFACDKDLVLYPKEPDKVFSKDCKTEETLSDMRRTETPAAGPANGSRTETSKTYTYILTADKKPSKKTLCYLCVDKDITESNHGTAADYCTIYVESDARTHLDHNCTFILALPCVLVAFQFT